MEDVLSAMWLISPLGLAMIACVAIGFAVTAREALGRERGLREAREHAHDDEEAALTDARDQSMKQATRRWLDVVVWHHTTHYREFQNRWQKGRDSYAHSAIDDLMPPPSGRVEARLGLRNLERIDPALRDVVMDFALGLTAEEIAAELGQNPNTIQERLARGRDQLRRVLRLNDAPTLPAIRSKLASMSPLREPSREG
ncbi:sigma factor-like helix-turn-helix DNA-binding protein [Sorangium sp. So ce302]|uniref:RNA polymerase sigma factor n=1 Tax=Sorangium sp. So ce302 TaxID=3133297 RepID=UPI003F5F98D4